MLASPEALMFIEHLLIAMAVGGLIGLEREWKKSAAGLRTMILMSAAGMISTFIASKLDAPYALLVFMFFACVLSVTVYIVKAQKLKEPGLTTSVALLIAFALGILVQLGFVLESVMAAILVTFILAAKELLHKIVRRLSKQEIMDALMFGIVTFIVLPILPNHDYKFFDLIVFNPFKTWLFAVFVLGISFVAYIAMKSVGVEKGVSVTGLLGGLVSSTAVTASMASRAKANPKLVDSCATATLLASSVMFIRLAVIAGALSWEVGKRLALPFIGTAIIGFAFSMNRLRRPKKCVLGKESAVGSPFAFKPAIHFAVLFAIIIAVSAIAHQYFGSLGIYIASVVGGFADLDAITVSSTALATTAPQVLTFTLAAISVMIAGLVNTLVKLGILRISGTKEMFWKLSKYFAVMLAGMIVLGYFSIMRFGF